MAEVMCGGVCHGEFEGLVCREVVLWQRSCVVEYAMGRLRDWSC